MNPGEFQDNESILYGITMVDICIIHLSKSVECAKVKMNPNKNYRLWVITICQCRFIDCTTCTTLAKAFDNEEGCACGELGGIWKLYILL